MRTWLVTLAAVLSAAIPGFCQDISRISVAPGIVTGGLSATGTVELVAPAKNPVSVVVAVGSPAASAPRSVMVAKGQTSATFSVNTVAVAADRIVNVEARGIASTKRTNFTIKSGVVPSVQSVTFNPIGVIGGTPSTARITLSAAPQGTLTLRLASTSDLITFPATTTLPSNATFVDVAISSKTVSEDTDVSLSAASSAGKATGVLALYTRAWAALDTLTVTPSTLIGGANATLTVTLKGPAAAGGQLIRLKSSHDAATVPATLTIGAGATSAQVTIRTAKVATDTDVSIVAAQRSSKLTNTMTIRAEKASNRMVSFAFAPLSVIGGGSSTGTVALENPAPTGGWKVRLLSSAPERVVVPSSVTVAAGAKTATFQATTTAVTRVETVSVSATDASGRISANLEVQPATYLNRIDAITVDPISVEGGASATGTVTLLAAAPTGGWKVRLTSSDPRVTVPATVTIAAGNRAVTFTISTQIPDRDTLVSLSGADATARRSVQFSLVKSPPTQLNTFTLTPSLVNGGDKLTGTVTLTKAAPTGGWTLRLSASDPLLPVPSSIKVDAGKTTATFDVVSGKTPRSTDVFVSVVDGARRQTAMATILPGLPSDVELSQLTLVPTQVQGGKRALGTVGLNKVAPAGGALIRLTSTASDLTFPKTVLVAAGSTTATFNIDTPVVSADRTVSLAATDGRKRFEATLTLVKENATVELVSVTTTEAVVPSGASTVGTVTLAAPAPTAGVRVRLAVSVGTITVPKDVYVAPNTSTATFSVTTSTVREDVEASIAATYSGQKKSCALIVSAAVTYDLSKVVFNGPSVVGGETLTGKVILDGPAPEAGLRVRLVSDSSTFTVPKTVLVPSGAKEASFVATADFVSAATNVVVLGAGRRTRSTTTVQLVPAVSPILVGFEVNTLVPVGGAGQGTVTLDRPAGQRGFRVRLTTPDIESITIPREVLVPSGATKVSFDIRTELTEEVPVEIFAVAGTVQLRAESWVTTVSATVAGPLFRPGIVNAVTISTLNYGPADVENPWLAIVTTPRVPVSLDGDSWSDGSLGFQPKNAIVIPNSLVLGGNIVLLPPTVFSKTTLYYIPPAGAVDREASMVFQVLRDPRSYGRAETSADLERKAREQFIAERRRPQVQDAANIAIYDRIVQLAAAKGVSGYLGALGAGERFFAPYTASEQLKGDARDHLLGYVLGTLAIPSLGSSLDVSTVSGVTAVSRTFSSSKADRDSVGMFGRGWQSDFDIRGHANLQDGELIGPGSAYTRGHWDLSGNFARQYRGMPDEHSFEIDTRELQKWTDRNSRFGNISFEANAGFPPDKNRYGKPIRRVNVDNSSIDYVYEGDRLVQARTSYGESLRFEYNSLGLVKSVIDDHGRVVRYRYYGELGSSSGMDPKHLESVTKWDGSTTRYIYKPLRNADGTESWTGGVLIGTVSNERWGQFSEWNEFQPTRRWVINPDGGVEQELNINVRLFGPTTLTSSTQMANQVLVNNGLSIYTENGLGQKRSTRMSGNDRIETDERGNRTITKLGESGVTQFTDQAGRIWDSMSWNEVSKTLRHLVDPLERVLHIDRSYRTIDGVRYEVVRHRSGAAKVSTETTGTVREYWIRDSDQRVLKSINPSGLETRYEYDVLGRPSKLDFGGGFTLSTGYDGFGRVISNTDSTRGQRTIEYDNRDLIVKTVDEFGVVKSFTYDLLNRLTGIATSFGYAVSYEYDSRDRLVSVRDSRGVVLETYTYDAEGRLSTRSRPSGEILQQQYDVNGRWIGVKKLLPAGIAEQKYQLDYRGVLTGQSVYGIQRAFEHDNVDQLTTETGPDGIKTTYQYDAIGNRTQVSNSNGQSQRYVHNSRNQTLTVNSDTFSYDVDGNMTSFAGSPISWDRLGRMTSVGNVQVAYDIEGNISELNVDGSRRRLVYLGDKLIAELDAAGTLVRSYYYGFGMVAQQQGTATRWVDQDRMGSVVALTNDQGVVVGTATYDAYGNGVGNGELAATTLGWQSAVKVGPFVSFGARMYSPQLGRFISEDPILFAGGYNLYSYAGNSPAMHGDATGLCPERRSNPFEPWNIVGPMVGQHLEDWATAIGIMAGVMQTGSELELLILWSLRALALPVTGSAVAYAGGLVVLGAVGYVFWNTFGDVIMDEIKSYLNKPKGPVAVPAISHGPFGGKPLGLPITLPAMYPLGPLSGFAMPQSNGSPCPPPSPPGGAGAGGGITRNFTAVDPNDKLGPDGIGPEHWLSTLKEPLDYTIRFENVGVAAAVEVELTDALPVELDPATVELTGISFGSVTRSYGEGTYRVSDRVSLAGTKYEVLIDAAETNGNIRWFMRIVDPETGRAPIDGTGFLPRNNRSIGNGEGAVSFRVRPKASVKTGDEIANGASIRFDGGTLNTNVYKNKLDLEAPESAVDALPAETTNPDITLNWSGSDGKGSGIASYDVYVSTDGGEYIRIAEKTTNTTLTFAGQQGKRYRFFTQATDKVGKQEAAPVNGFDTEVIVR
jgi:RHS repeat-associated protein